MGNQSSFLSFIAVFVLAACVADSPAPETALSTSAASTIEFTALSNKSDERIAADLLYLADDARQGREAGTEAYEEAARYVAARMDSIGLEPGADGTWFQSVPLRSVKRDLDAAFMSITGKSGVADPLMHLGEFIIGRSIAQTNFNVTAPVVFAGYGVIAPRDGHDDYATIDARGKIVVVFSDAPSHFDSEKRAFYRSNDNKIKTAAANGAVGLITLPTKKQIERSPWMRISANPEREAMTWVHPDGVGEISAREIQATAFMSPTGAEKLFADEQFSFADLQTKQDASEPINPFALGKEVTLKGASIFEEKTSPNVVGLIKGSDPELANEVIVLTAHLDHVGVHEPPQGGTDHIHNGALDNALGVAIMLDVAAQFKKNAPPKRSILVLAVTAEEKGLLGADYFAHYPTLAAGKIVANVNLDMPLTLYPFVDVIAFGAERSSLGSVVREAAASMNVTLIPDPMPELGIFTRSDHYRFVEKGIPSVFLFMGFGNGGEEVFSNFMANHYHQPSDDFSLPIDYKEAARFADLNYRIARNIANAEEAPSWNDGDFFGERFGR